jgi:hypothetical protein
MRMRSTSFPGPRDANQATFSSEMRPVARPSENALVMCGSRRLREAGTPAAVSTLPHPPFSVWSL